MSAAFSTEELKARFEVGKKWEKYVAEQLQIAGIPAVMTCGEWIENANVKQLTEDDLDIVVGDIVIEVKSRHGKTQFGWEPESYPYETAIVDTKPGWDAKRTKPDYYILVSSATGAMLVVDGKDHDKWITGVFYDSYERKRNVCYVTQKDCLHTFEWLVDKLGS